MMFTAQGKRDGRAFSVIWEDGVLRGNPVLLHLIRAEAGALEGHLVGPVGQQTNTKHLQTALSALIIIDKVLPGAEFNGEVPKVGSTPKDAIL